MHGPCIHIFNNKASRRTLANGGEFCTLLPHASVMPHSSGLDGILHPWGEADLPRRALLSISSA